MPTDLITTLDISLSPEFAKRLRERAAAAGVDIRSYATKILEDELRKESLDELLAPLRRRFAESGVGEQELAEDLERERQAPRHEKRSPPGA